MVVAGDFSAQLVNAETKEPFQEHFGEKGEAYSEIEPDCEYFIQFQMLGDGDAKKKVCVQVAVDGTLMESRTIVNRKSGKVHLGMLSRENGNTISKAFALRSPTVRYNDNLKKDACMPIGSVSIRISEAAYYGCQESMNYKEEGLADKSKDGSLEVPYDYGIFEAKKFLRSTEGKTLLAGNNKVTPEKASSNSAKHERKRKRRNEASYTAGLLLQEINIHYCTALGLIHAGVLDKPPMWDLFRKKQNYGKRQLPQSPRPRPTKRIKLKAQYDGDVLISPAKTIEMFDLTTTLALEADGDDSHDSDSPDAAAAAAAAANDDDDDEEEEHNEEEDNNDDEEEEDGLATRSVGQTVEPGNSDKNNDSETDNDEVSPKQPPEAALDTLAHICYGGMMYGLQN